MALGPNASVKKGRRAHDRSCRIANQLVEATGAFLPRPVVFASLNGRGGASGRSMGPERQVVIRADRIDAVIFDMDGVVTDTAKVHAAAWTRLFDRFLRDRATTTGGTFRPFTVDDYLRSIDGKPRYDGVRSFLATRGITLPRAIPPIRRTARRCAASATARTATSSSTSGSTGSRPSLQRSRCSRSCGRRPNRRRLREPASGRGTGGRSRRTPLRCAGGGSEADRLGLAGKPDPSVFLEAARRLRVRPRRAAVVEDALAVSKPGAGAGSRSSSVSIARITGSSSSRRAPGWWSGISSRWAWRRGRAAVGCGRARRGTWTERLGAGTRASTRSGRASARLSAPWAMGASRRVAPRPSPGPTTSTTRARTRPASTTG